MSLSIILGAVFAGMVSAMSRRFGRKPMLGLSLTLVMMQSWYLALLRYRIPLSGLWCLMIISAVSNWGILFDIIIKDTSEESERATMLGFMAALGTLASIPGCFLPKILSKYTCSFVSASGSTAAWLLYVTLMPETLPLHEQTATRLFDLFCGFSCLRRVGDDLPPWKLMAIFSFHAGLISGIALISFPYLKMHLGIDMSTWSPVVSGQMIGSATALIFLLGPSTRLLGLRRSFAMAATGQGLGCLAVALSPNTTCLYLTIPLASVASFTLPCAMSIMINACPTSGQAKALG